jgi:maleate isomerase
MKDRVLLGMLTPSSNTVLEPVIGAMLTDLPDVTTHFGRFRVTEISLCDAALGQFDRAPILEAVRLLADARLDVIAWNGTSSAWLGFDTDHLLSVEIERETGIPATSSVLALNETFAETEVSRFGLVTPYTDEIQESIIKNYAGAGFECVAERHLRKHVNFEFSEVTETEIAEMIRAVAAEKPEAITILCTNMRGAAIAEAMEAELGIPIYDTVSTAVWKSMRLAGADPRRVKGWGRLFTEVAYA